MNDEIQIELALVDAPKSQEVKTIALTAKDKARFEAKFKRGVRADDCWLWTAGKFDSGYGCFSISPPKRLYRAHRVSYQIYKGNTPVGMLVCHSCDTPACVNPDHLWLGDSSDNMVDRARKGRGRKQDGEASSFAKTTNEVVLEIRALYATGVWQQKQLAARFGLGKIGVFHIVHRQTWKHI